MNRLVRGAIGLCVLLLVGCASNGEPHWRLAETGPEAADFTLPQLDGSPVTLSELKGRVVVLDFWATWCGPCRMALPSLEAVSKRYRDRGVTVLLVNEGESPERIRKWARRRFTAPILLDQEMAVADRYQVEGIPRLVLIDRQGRIRLVHEGYGGGLERDLGQALDILLAPDVSSTDA